MRMASHAKPALRFRTGSPAHLLSPESWGRCLRASAPAKANSSMCRWPTASVRAVGDVTAWPHLRERGMLQMLKHPSVPLQNGPLAPEFPLKFSETPTGYFAPAAAHGQHNNEIYRK